MPGQTPWLRSGLVFCSPLLEAGGGEILCFPPLASAPSVMAKGRRKGSNDVSTSTELLSTAERRSQAVAYAEAHGAVQAAEKFGITVRTVQRWIKCSDTQATDRVAEMLHAAGDEWAREVLTETAALIIEGARRTRQLVADGERLTPSEVRAWGGAMKLANDALTTLALLEERKKGAKPAPRAVPAPVVALTEREEAA